MPYEFYPLAFGTALILGLVGFGVVRKSLRERTELKLREMIHKERIVAMEKDVPLPELPQEGGQGSEVSTGTANQISEAGVIWVRLSSLCLGLFLSFAGAGMSVAFALWGDGEINEIWPVGIIPLLAGVGLLLFCAMSRGYESQLRDKRYSETKA